MPRQSAALLAIVTVLLAACQAVGSPVPSGTSSGLPPSSAASTPPSPTTTAPSELPTTEPIPSDELGEFSCDFPVVMQATAVETMNILDVRVGTHDGYDRVVFEFSVGTPEFTLDRAEPPFFEDASGRDLTVEGSSFLGLIMRGATKMTETGGSSYSGPTDFDPGFPQLVDLVQGGDFEAQSTWYFGLNSDVCARVLLLTEPDRLVIDLEH